MFPLGHLPIKKYSSGSRANDFGIISIISPEKHDVQRSSRSVDASNSNESPAASLVRNIIRSPTKILIKSMSCTSPDRERKLKVQMRFNRKRPSEPISNGEENREGPSQNQHVDDDFPRSSTERMMGKCN